MKLILEFHQAISQHLPDTLATKLYLKEERETKERKLNHFTQLV